VLGLCGAFLGGIIDRYLFIFGGRYATPPWRSLALKFVSIGRLNQKQLAVNGSFMDSY